MHITISTVPKADIDAFIDIMSKGDAILFFSTVLQFGEAVMRELRSGSVFTAGTNFLGYSAMDITLSGKVKTITNVGWNKEITLPDVPDAQRLRILTKQTGLNDPNQLLERFVYWLWLASQMRWMEYSLFAMNAREKRWQSFHFKPLDDVSKQLSY